MSAAVLRARAVRSLATSSRASPLVARAAYLHVRKYVTTPDPTHPMDSRKPSDVPTPKGSGNTIWLILATTSAAVGGWYYMSQSEENIHEKRKADEAEAKAKAQELADAGKRTAHDVVKEGEKGYNELKASGSQKLDEARAQADSYVISTKASAANTYNAAAQKVDEAEAHAKAALDDAKHMAEETKQSWGAWFGSWFGYGKHKAEEVKREGAAEVASAASKVEKEAGKRT